MRRAAAVLSAVLAFGATPAFAQSAEHSIPWFAANDAARRDWIAACRDDHRLAAERPHRAVCANAEAAESRLYARRGPARARGARPFRGFEELDRPGYWRADPGRRAMLRAACARRASHDRPLLRYCGLAG